MTFNFDSYTGYRGGWNQNGHDMKDDEGNENGQNMDDEAGNMDDDRGNIDEHYSDEDGSFNNTQLSP